MTTTQSSSHRWPLIVLAIVGLVVLSPFILALLFAGLALTIGIAATAIKIGVVVGVIWLIAAVFKSLFGHRPPKPIEPAVRTSALMRLDPDLEMRREREESLAALDRELAKAQAQPPRPSET